jgi:hypothetical protein
MDNDDDKDNKDTVLEIIPSNQLRLIPLYAIITHIYEDIIEKAAECEFTYTFMIENIIKDYKIKKKIATPGNKTYIINEIKRLFPGIKITEHVAPSYFPDGSESCWSASWEEELDDVFDSNSDKDKWETCNSEDCDDIILKQAIEESLKEEKKTERANNSIILEKTEERIQKAREKYKKLYNN